ncbi:MAG: HU family DNA-binding protein [Paludibacteraceae bacterium]|nr:HU family DNA-binding protein [Paludibacteraceae bacterium]
MENKKITLQELADVISAHSGATKRFTDSFLRELVVVIQEYLEKDGIVKVKGLGTFKLLWIEARKSVNVATKETIVLPAHYKLSFTPEDSVKQELNTAENLVSGGATIIQDAENEVETIENENQVVLQEVEIPLETNEEPLEEESDEQEIVTEETPEEESKQEIVVAEPKNDVSEPENVAESPLEPKETVAPESSERKSHKTLVIIIIVLVLVIICLAAYIMIPNVEGKLMGLFKPTLKETNFEVVSAPADSTNLERDTISVEVEKPAEPEAEVQVKDELPAQPMITVENYTPSIAKNAPVREVVTVIDGSRLTMVAYRAYGHKAFWVYVFDANRDRLKRPSDVEKGMELRIPDLPKSLVNSKDQRCLDKAYELAKQYDK